MIKRDIEGQLRRYLRIFPVVLVAGPRQSGKTTLVRSALKGWDYLDLERSKDFGLLESDPEAYLQRHPDRLIIDEAQRLPSLMAVLRGVVDKNRKPGRFVLTGSAHPSLVRGAGETLAGRIGILEVAPFGISELRPRPAWLRQRWFWGGLAPLYSIRRNADKYVWLDSYISTFLERDIPGLGLRLPAARLRRLWSMLAHVHGNLLNTLDLGRSLDLSSHTVNHYLDTLEGAFMIRRLAPYFVNIGKRLTKSPKLYIRDSGLMHHLSELREPGDLERWSRLGASWEGYLVEELIRLAQLRVLGAKAYFWRTQAGAEVDLLLVAGRRKVAVEIKAGVAISGHSLKGLRQCMEDLDIRHAFLLHKDTETTELGRGITALPWTKFEEVLKPLL